MNRCTYVIHISRALWSNNEPYEDIRCAEAAGHGYDHTSADGTIQWSSRQPYLSRASAPRTFEHR